jgi:hypothetical protein
VFERRQEKTMAKSLRKGYRRNEIVVVAVATWGVAACGEDSGEDIGTSREALTVIATFQQGVNSYTGSTDTHIRQASTTSNYGNATTCQADGDDGSGTDKYCLIRWALSGIPSGATVTAASITLRVTDSTTQGYSLYQLNRTWNENQATWNRATSSVTWGSPGALASSDRGPVVGSVSGSGTQTVVLNGAGLSMVQSWISGGTNAGIIVAHATNTNGIDFASSEHGTVSYRPRLSITYETASGTGGTGAGGAGTGGSATGGTATGGTGGSGTSGTSGGGTGGTGGSGTAGMSNGGGGGSGGTDNGGAGTGGSATGGSATGGSGGGATAPDTLVAFIGDQGNNGNSDAVLNLIKSEGAAATVHNGDFDYADNPTAWDDRITTVLGANYPYFALVGNHDAAAWGGANGYGAKIAARHSRVSEMACTGDLGVKATCNFRGLYMVQSCVGTSELTGHGDCSKDSSEQVGFISDALANDSSIWSVCLWHKNQNDMQIGTKGDEVGWNAYRACMNGGAIVSTGHEHSYARTLALTDLGNRAAGHGATGAHASVNLGFGQTFVFVSGLAGVGIRAYSATGHDDDTWWSSYYASNRWMMNGVLQSGTARYGALFIRFNVGGDPRRADAYFKDVQGRIADQFTITAQ